ncbi:MAG: dihydroorotase [Gammaproteobacteria bacterium]
MSEEITIRKPDDWHLHLRDGDTLRNVLPYTTAYFKRAIVMPNLVPPVIDGESASAYRERILDAAGDAKFEPLMTAYLTDRTVPDELAAAHRNGFITAAKLYPAGATTNAESGVSDVKKIYSVFEAMQKTDMPLLVHGEVVGEQYDIYDREKIFIDTTLSRIHQDFPELRIVFEHITTAQGVEFVQQTNDHIAATITPHHLTINRSTMFRGGIRPHFYCLPIAKRREHQIALRHAATSGNEKFFLGTDSAPHSQAAKQSDCGCAGVFNAATALSCYAQVFDEENALDKLENFASINGPNFYRLPLNDGFITLQKQTEPLSTPETVGDERIHHFLPDTPVYWRVVESAN